MITDTQVWTKRLSSRDVARVGRALREAGYKITNERLRKMYYIVTVARYFYPLDAQERSKIYDIILRSIDAR